tara:strand:+ start:37 stop:453 length:417 start_codon:yes stop_codon:yes gene_type:complete
MPNGWKKNAKGKFSRKSMVGGGSSYKLGFKKFQGETANKMVTWDFVVREGNQKTWLIGTQGGGRGFLRARIVKKRRQERKMRRCDVREMQKKYQHSMKAKELSNVFRIEAKLAKTLKRLEKEEKAFKNRKNELLAEFK